MPGWPGQSGATQVYYFECAFDYMMCSLNSKVAIVSRDCPAADYITKEEFDRAVLRVTMICPDGNLFRYHPSVQKEISSRQLWLASHFYGSGTHHFPPALQQQRGPEGVQRFPGLCSLDGVFHYAVVFALAAGRSLAV